MKCFPLHISEEQCVTLSDELFSFATDSETCSAFECVSRCINVSSHNSLEHLTGFINTNPAHAQDRKSEDKSISKREQNSP